MSDSILVEGIKLFGGIIAFILGGFTLYDRFVKGLPIAAVRAEPKRNEDDLPFLRLVVRNPSSRDIIVRKIISSRPELIIGSDETVTSILRGPEELSCVAVIEAGSERIFRMYLHEKGEDPADLPLTIEIEWHPLTARFNRPPLRLGVSTRLLRDLGDEADRRRRAEKEIRAKAE